MEFQENWGRQLLAQYEETEKMAALKEQENRDNPYEAKLWRSMKESTHYTKELLRRCLGDVTARVEAKTSHIAISDNDTLDWLAFHHGMFHDEAPVADSPEEEETLPPEVLWSAILTRQQYACIMAFTRGWSESKIADYLGINRDTVKTHLKRAREKLKKKREVPLSLFEEDSTSYIG